MCTFKRRKELGSNMIFWKVKAKKESISEMVGWMLLFAVVLFILLIGIPLAFNIQ